MYDDDVLICRQSPQSGINVVGQGLQQTPGRGEGQPEGGAEETMATPRAPSAGVSVAWSSQPNSPKDFAMVDQVGVLQGGVSSVMLPGKEMGMK